MGIIYCITFPSGKQYVGQTTQLLKERIGQHLRSNTTHLICRAMKKYASSYKVEILQEPDDEQIDFYETQFITSLNTLHPNGYNLSTGGGSGRKHNELSREKMSETHAGVPLSDHHKQRLSESHMGRVFSEETKTKISQSKLGKSRGDDFRAHMSQKSRKVKSDLPMYVYKEKYGYRVRLPEDRGKDKRFTSRTLTEEANLKLVLEYIDSKKKVSND